MAAAGAENIVSAHLSADLSGTYDAALLAAAEAPIPVTVVDSRSVSMGLGYGVIAAARVLAQGADVAQAADAVTVTSAASRVLFYVDSLDFLRRGGRIGAAQRLVGSALAVKPILHLAKGRVQPLEKVRTAARAMTRLEDLAVESAGDAPVGVAVLQLDAERRAEDLAERLRTRLPEAEVLLGTLGPSSDRTSVPGWSPWSSARSPSRDHRRVLHRRSVGTAGCGCRRLPVRLGESGSDHRPNAGIDLHHEGSGNPGATNAGRVLGKKTGILVGVLDVPEGPHPRPVVHGCGVAAAELAGFMAVIGHITSPFLRGRGGKGGDDAGRHPRHVSVVGSVRPDRFAVGYLLSRRVGIGAVVAALVLIGCGVFTDDPDARLFGIALGLLVLVRHWRNIGAAWRDWRSDDPQG